MRLNETEGIPIIGVRHGTTACLCVAPLCKAVHQRRGQASWAAPDMETLLRHRLRTVMKKRRRSSLGPPAAFRPCSSSEAPAQPSPAFQPSSGNASGRALLQVGHLNLRRPHKLPAQLPSSPERLRDRSESDLRKTVQGRRERACEAAEPWITCISCNMTNAEEQRSVVFLRRQGISCHGVSPLRTTTFEVGPFWTFRRPLS